ncbi:MAG: hypoxanthine phosphoribosyltransferase [Aeriscardovia sp.]|nr:hypoxanthine phosphoribosyltransferase [Aeriscardovia sp.]
MEIEDVRDDIEKVLLTKEQIQRKIKDTARRVDEDYGGKDLVLVGVLKGAVNVMTALMNYMHTTCPIGFMSLSSYGEGFESSGQVKVRSDLNVDVEGKDVLIVEDIVDSGNTLHWLMGYLSNEKKARSVNVFPLLSKPSHRQWDIYVKYPGYELEDEFVIGFGLDYKECYRNLDAIAVLKPSVYSQERM